MFVQLSIADRWYNFHIAWKSLNSYLTKHIESDKIRKLQRAGSESRSVLKVVLLINIFTSVFYEFQQSRILVEDYVGKTYIYIKNHPVAPAAIRSKAVVLLPLINC